MKLATPEVAFDADASRLLDMIHAGWMSQALCAAVDVGLIDELAAGPRSAPQLAGALGCDSGALERLIRALASLGIVLERDDGGCELADLGQRLRRDAPNSLYAQAQWFGHYSWPLWGQLAQSVRTGQSARERAPEHGGYGHLQADPAAAQTFNLAMVQLTRLVAAGVVARCNFHGVREFVDVGGGFGELLAACLAAQPQASGLLLELAHALPGARQHLAQAGLAGRSVVQEGDFFAAIPDGADVYLLKAVLHNWDSEHCATILANVRCALPAHGRIVVVERVIPDRREAVPAHQVVLRSDLNMLIGLGGRERTAREFAALFQAAGFGAPTFTALPAAFHAIEARAAARRDVLP